MPTSTCEPFANCAYIIASTTKAPCFVDPPHIGASGRTAAFGTPYGLWLEPSRLPETKRYWPVGDIDNEPILNQPSSPTPAAWNSSCAVTIPVACVHRKTREPRNPWTSI